MGTTQSSQSNNKQKHIQQRTQQNHIEHNHTQNKSNDYIKEHLETTIIETNNNNNENNNNNNSQNDISVKIVDKYFEDNNTKINIIPVSHNIEHSVRKRNKTQKD